MLQIVIDVQIKQKTKKKNHYFLRNKKCSMKIHLIIFKITKNYPKSSEKMCVTIVLNETFNVLFLGNITIRILYYVLHPVHRDHR